MSITLNKVIDTVTYYVVPDSRKANLLIWQIASSFALAITAGLARRFVFTKSSARHSCLAIWAFAFVYLIFLFVRIARQQVSAIEEHYRNYSGARTRTTPPPFLPDAVDERETR